MVLPTRRSRKPAVSRSGPSIPAQGALRNGTERGCDEAVRAFHGSTNVCNGTVCVDDEADRLNDEADDVYEGTNAVYDGPDHVCDGPDHVCDGSNHVYDEANCVYGGANCVYDEADRVL